MHCEFNNCSWFDKTNGTPAHAILQIYQSGPRWKTAQKMWVRCMVRDGLVMDHTVRHEAVDGRRRRGVIGMTALH